MASARQSQFSVAFVVIYLVIQTRPSINNTYSLPCLTDTWTNKELRNVECKHSSRRALS